MSEGNKRYLGDVFINSENYETQREFFKDIIESYQYKYGGDFDASTLQGKTIEDFATSEQGEKAESAILSPLLFGKTEIANISDPQYIYTDAILLGRSNSEDFAEEGDLDELDWYKNLNKDNLTEALVDIYNQVKNIQDSLNANIDAKTDSTNFNELEDRMDALYDNFVEENGNSFDFNASYVNGLRFILISQDDYDNLSSEEQNYWKNVFIIKDANQIPPAYNAPYNLALTDGYSFRVALDVEEGEYFLDVTNGLTNDTWQHICSLDELLSGVDLDSHVLSSLERTLLEAIENISPSSINNNWESYPFLSSSLHDDFVEEIKINGSSSKVTTTINNETKFKTVDLDINSIATSIATSITNSIVNPLKNNTVNPLSQKVTALEQTVGTNTSEIDTISDQITGINRENNNRISDITSLRSQLNTIQRDLNSISSNLSSSLSELNNSIKTWTEIELINNSKQRVTLYVNEFVRICELKYQNFVVTVPQANGHQTLHEGLIPEAYRPNRYIYGPVNIDQAVMSVTPKGNIGLRGGIKRTNKEEYYTTIMWHY